MGCPMSDVILHHYPASPFAEKARLMLGFKGLSWRSVLIPPVMPKPDLVALTGGYRKTPVLQIGADIYCDTAMIARRLDQEKAFPALFPDGLEMTVPTFAAWVDSVVFQHAVSLVFQPESLKQKFARLPESAVERLMADRAQLFSGGAATRLPVEQVKHQWPAIMARLEQQLEDEEGDYLFGEPSYADFAMAHPLWFLKGTSVTSPYVDQYPAVHSWLGRVLGFGHGSFTELSGEDAIAIAKAAEPAALPEQRFSDPSGVEAGERVAVSAVDYGVDPVEGTLAFVSAETLVVKREDERAGEVHVHFPRLGFRLERR